MFFWLSKIFWILFSPLTFIALIFCVGFTFLLLRRDTNWGLKVIGSGALLYILMAFFPLGHNALVLLEKSAVNLSQKSEDIQNSQAVISLGGCLNPIGIESMNKQSSYMNGACERIIEAAALQKKYNIPLIYSGGNGRIKDNGFTESETAKELFSKIGFKGQVLYEKNSRNTYENASKLAEIINKDEPIILVTSASHMPRATSVFCSQGWDTYPHAVDYQTDLQYRIWPNLDSHGNVLKLNTAFKEYIGLLSYWITDKIPLKACPKIVH